MKKLMQKAMLLILITGIIPCQAQEKVPARYGFIGGINISNLYTNDASTADMIFGFNLGVFAKIPTISILSVQPELYVTTKGASVTYNSLLVDGTANFNLTYMELPVLGLLRVSDHINLQFGPYVSYLLAGKVTNMANVHLLDLEKSISMSNYNRLDAGLVLGVGVEAHSMTMGIRYNYGLTNAGRKRTLLDQSYTIPNASNGIINFYLSVPVN
jgi:hypothetical protein